MKDWKTFKFGQNRNVVIQRARSTGAIKRGDPLDHPNPKIKCELCPRTTQADMFVELDGKWVCDACWSDVRRKDRFEARQK
jgi:hypothetical protein